MKKWPLSKPENVPFAPCDQAIQSQLSLQVYHQKCILREPYAVNPRRHPPIFIDFLLTYSSRKNPTPARSGLSGRSGSGLGGHGLGLGLGGQGLVQAVWVLAVKVWVLAVKVWVLAVKVWPLAI